MALQEKEFLHLEEPVCTSLYQTALPAVGALERREVSQPQCTVLHCECTDDESGGEPVCCHLVLTQPNDDMNDPLNRLIAKESYNTLPPQYQKWLDSDISRHHRILNMTLPASCVHDLLCIPGGTIRKQNRARMQDKFSIMEFAYG